MVESRTSPTAPAQAVLEAFGASGTPEQLAGGRGLAWRSGAVVLRPAGDPEEVRWTSEKLAELTAENAAQPDGAAGFRVPRPFRDNEGNWTRGGWQALEWVPGKADEARVDDILRAGEAFHRATAGLARPSFIDAAATPWSVADRVAWGELTCPADRLLHLLLAEYQPVETPPQVIHGDLLGNVLFAEGRSPAVIDWAPYWRPPGFGAAIAVMDAACWHDYPLASLADHHGIPHWRQLLLRALVFRITALRLLGHWNAPLTARHAPVAAAVITLPG